MEVSANKIRFSVLDQVAIREGGTAADAIRETVELAQRAESLGYHRYWLRNIMVTDGLAGLLPRDYGDPRCRRDTRDARRLGRWRHAKSLQPVQGRRESQGLENMYPGRIDPDRPVLGSDQRTAIALAYGSQVGIEYFPAKIRDMAAFLDDTLPKDHPLTGVTATPRTESVPEIWILASSEGSTTLAARYGMGLSTSISSIRPIRNPSCDLYRESFQPSAYLKQPALTMGIFVLCTETEAEAERIISSRDLHRLRADRGIHGPMPSPETALSYTFSEVEKRRIQQNRQRLISLGHRQGQSQDRGNGRDIRLPRIHHSFELLRVRSPYPLL